MGSTSTSTSAGSDRPGSAHDMSGGDPVPGNAAAGGPTLVGWMRGGYRDILFADGTAEEAVPTYDALVRLVALLPCADRPVLDLQPGETEECTVEAVARYVLSGGTEGLPAHVAEGMRGVLEAALVGFRARRRMTSA